MLVVETIAKIRRAYFAQNKPIKTICREFRVSRRVVRKVIRSQATIVCRPKSETTALVGTGILQNVVDVGGSLGTSRQSQEALIHSDDNFEGRKQMMVK